jgi:hypothetical protein
MPWAAVALSLFVSLCRREFSVFSSRAAELNSRRVSRQVEAKAEIGFSVGQGRSTSKHLWIYIFFFFF